MEDIGKFLEKATATSVNLAGVSVMMEHGDITVEQAEQELGEMYGNDEYLPPSVTHLEMVASHIPVNEWHIVDSTEDGRVIVEREFCDIMFTAFGEVGVDGELIGLTSRTRAMSFIEWVMVDAKRNKKKWEQRRKN